MAEQDLDRNQNATPYKLQKAKERGQVSKSSDVISAIVFAVAVTYLTWQGWGAVREQFRFDQALLTQAGQAHAGALWPLVEHAVRATGAWLASLFFSLMLAAVVANILQTGPVLSFDPIKADFDRLNPVNGFKKVFSMRTLFDAFRACIKLSLLLGVAYYALVNLAPQFYSLSGLSPLRHLHTLVDDMSALGLKMLMIVVVIAMLDLIYSKREFAKKMRMSKRELKDETKNREGDPRIRSRLRDLRNQMRKRSQSLKQTKNADVVVTNPTHVAVALRYVHGQMQSPEVLAKGVGPMAAAMRAIAAKHHIPVVQSPALARRLYKELDVQHHVPEHLFAEVARIIVWVFAMRERHTRKPGMRLTGQQAVSA